ncbi:MAG: nitroreductase family protein [Fusobacterium ulcerans]|uniref:nitroreductase family protein n=1 Tax=Fusobacterium ulcerans TaxID=861 RepID=UPI003A8698B0
MKLNIPIEETINKRVSVRTYQPKQLSISDKKKITDEIELLSNPFDEKVRIHIIEKEDGTNTEKLGTYGVIKGAKTYLGVTVSKSEKGLLAAGFQLENLVLYATYLELGTVWLAATFNREQFGNAIDVQKDEIFPAISPIGYPTEKRSVTESIMRKTMNSNNRKPWAELFFNEEFGKVLTEEDAGEYAKSLEMLRKAPSAKNAQPWRVLKNNKGYHFFETHNEKTSDDEKMIKIVDVGIGLSHFYQMALDKGLEGRFEKLQNLEINIPENTQYLISWIAL